ncbi:ABC multidrug transporter E [Pseudocercospora fuligena]|uniref:ABC multidrug transporter E n=1 Tax=Pseudocercospora fuligena TaxID=685502 RepID=A0A8H6VTV6_9PEZI|nr:ABC multidrug transporter E [Pseudocercospora fuligena]
MPAHSPQKKPSQLCKDNNDQRMAEQSVSREDLTMSKSSGGRQPAHQDKHGESREQKGDPKGSMLTRILSYAASRHRWTLAASALLSGLSGATLPIMNVALGRLVDTFGKYIHQEGSISRNDFQGEINRLALWVVYIFAAKLIMSFTSKYAFQHVGLVLAAELRKAYFTAMLNLPVHVVENLKPGAAVYALTEVVTSIQNNIANKVEILAECIGLIVSAYVVGFVHSWALTLASTSLVLLTFVCYGTIGPKVNELDRAITKTNSSAAAESSNALRSIRVVKSLGAEDAIIARYCHWNRIARQHGQKKSPYLGALFGLYFFCAYANIALSFFVGTALFRGRHISSVRDIVTVLFSLVAIMPAVGAIAPLLISINRAVAGAEVIFDQIDAETAATDGLRVDVNADILFHDVHFAYPSRPHTPALRGLQLRIPHGSTTALIGASGCGKSTVVALLERWYSLSHSSTAHSQDHSRVVSDTGSLNNEKPGNQGAITLGQYSLDELDERWWRSQIGLVEQQSILFDESIYENVCRGLIGTQWNDQSEHIKRELVVEACKDAYAHDFILRQDQGYDTMVGEGGVRLSSGQRQRIAIARCIVKKPALLIFDEATSSLDNHSAKIVERAMARAAAGKTCLIITHRLSSVQDAEQIAVMEEGVVVEQGSREQLLGQSGSKFNQLLNVQRFGFGTDGTRNIQKDAGLSIRDGEPGDDVKDGFDETLIEEEKVLAGGVLPDGDSNTANHGYLYTLLRLLASFRRHRLPYTLLLAAAMAAGGVNCAQAIIVSKFIVAFQNSKDHHVSRANFWASMATVLAIVVTVGYIVLGYAINYISVDVSNSACRSYFEAMLYQPVSWYDRSDVSSEDLTSRLSNDPQQVQEVSGPNMVLPLVGVFSLIASLILGLVTGWKLTLVAATGALPLVLIASLMRNRCEKYFESFNTRVYLESGKYAAESVRAFRTVTALTLETTVIARYTRLLEGHTGTALLRARVAALIYALGNSLEYCSMALSFWYGGKLLARNEYDVYQFMVIFVAIVQGGQTAGVLISLGPNISQATPALNRIYDMCVQRRSSKLPVWKEDDGLLSIAHSGASVEFQTVTFAYDTKQTPILRDLSFSVKEGEHIAIVGPSGCGKTTILSLLQSFYAPISGQILIDGVNMEQIPEERLRSFCSLVSQDPTLFEGTIRENLTLGLSRSTSMGELEEACQAARIHDFILSLPQGFDTPLSAALHANMSGGQKQRLCLARSLIRRPRLLLLDEATSNLDSDNESAIQQAIEKIGGTGRLSIIAVAHRLATVRNVQRILVLGEDGRIREQGNHEELVRQGGIYANMCLAQAIESTR